MTLQDKVREKSERAIINQMIRSLGIPDSIEEAILLDTYEKEGMREAWKVYRQIREAIDFGEMEGRVF